jgi:hypothetical protein
LAVALLTRFVPDNEPLVGDLIEEFEVRRSHLWFWRQAVLAILIGRRQRDDEVRPLRLVENPSAFAAPKRESNSTALLKPINLAASPIRDVGGLGLIALGVLITVIAPAAWWLVAFALVGGVALGVVLLVVSRRRVLSSSRGVRPSTLFGDRTRP